MDKYMEKLLDMPLRKILPVIQEGIMNQATYFGVGAQKNPMDAWVYQEIMHETKPDVIIEIGTAYGGGTLFLAHLCDLLGKGRIIGLDITHQNVPEIVKNHPRISLVEGDAYQNFEIVEKMVSKDERILIVEDSSHTYENTLNILRLYSSLIKVGGYFIVEDSICHHGLVIGPKPGPYEAIETFIAENNDFEIDRTREHFVITWNPKGYLRRIAVNHAQSFPRIPETTAASRGKCKSSRGIMKLLSDLFTRR